MKLIQLTEAAQRLGVSRQTLTNWGNTGVIKMHRTGKSGNCLWVDADTLDALGDKMKDVERSRLRLEQEDANLQAAYKREHAKLTDIHRQMFMIETMGTSIYAMEFYLAIPAMLVELEILTERECTIMQRVISGTDIGRIAQDFGLTRSRIMHIFYRGCRRAKCLSTINEKIDELELLKEEVTELRQTVRVLIQEVKQQQSLQDMTEEERIQHIRETDEMLKVFNTRLIDCDLSVRALNCLRSAELETVGDLARVKKSDLIRFRNFGRKSINELDDFLSDKGLTFGMDVDKVYRDRIAQRLQENNDNENKL